MINVVGNFLWGVENVSCMAWHENEAEASNCFAQALNWLF